METFMGENFLLSNEWSRKLYHQFAAKMPIVDYHCHIDPKEIALDKRFENITQLWLGGDHYKWRLMRSNGIDEYYITGKATDREKFQMWAKTLEVSIGNPLYHWSHLELQRYFDYYGVLNEDSAEEVWNHCIEKLKDKGMSAKSLIKKSNVEVLCTTDDPIDSLEWHDKIADDKDFEVEVLPAWRPDKVIAIEKDDFVDYLKKLEIVSGVKIDKFSDLEKALVIRMEFFASKGCVISDHGLEYVMYRPTDLENIDSIFKKRCNGAKLTEDEVLKYKTGILLFLGRTYHKIGWVMQLHYGIKRDNDKKRFEKLGPDTGFDSIATVVPINELSEFLNALAYTDELPKTILYSLNPMDNPSIGVMLGCFQNEEAVGKIQHGSAWWFNDHKQGMIDHMASLASLSIFGNFVGMLTDSRSFLSYTRHEYFRRILCEFVGKMVENGEYTADEKALRKIIEGICYKNAIRYFEFSGGKSGQ